MWKRTKLVAQYHCEWDENIDLKLVFNKGKTTLYSQYTKLKILTLATPLTELIFIFQTGSKWCSIIHKMQNISLERIKMNIM